MQRAKQIPPYVKVAAAGCLLAAGGFVAMHVDTVPQTGRKRLMFLSRETERRIGEQTFQDVLALHKGHILPPSHPKSKMVTRVGRRIAKVAGQDDFQWEFAVIDSPDANAFCVPGGKVCVFTGLFKTLRHEDGLAAVLGHEIAHAVARHSAEQMSMSALLLLGLLFLPTGSIQVARLAFTLGVDLPFSRMHELEADAIGLDLMAKACYDPRASPQMFADWEKQHLGTTVKYLSTHPPNTERSSLLRNQLKEPLAYFQKHCHDVRTNFGQIVAR
ncbi:Aste57867_23830 [Aphanomyces stellatus]|uniref:Aste57867_23830 protein n=1 Tax=Aphanomyces stellatus TaxID=120398 RepID=A0A485LQL0_9STRA|nr:hypothetical protein As57867_023757 [Aphanomyces stellatus]VFU00474.1 Aste57867_23830 [Aphanomyces stellatus]